MDKKVFALLLAALASPALGDVAPPYFYDGFDRPDSPVLGEPWAETNEYGSVGGDPSYGSSDVVIDAGTLAFLHQAYQGDPNSLLYNPGAVAVIPTPPTPFTVSFRYLPSDARGSFIVGWSMPLVWLCQVWIPNAWPSPPAFVPCEQEFALRIDRYLGGPTARAGLERKASSGIVAPPGFALIELGRLQGEGWSPMSATLELPFDLVEASAYDFALTYDGGTVTVTVSDGFTTATLSNGGGGGPEKASAPRMQSGGPQFSVLFIQDASYGGFAVPATVAMTRFDDVMVAPAVLEPPFEVRALAKGRFKKQPINLRTKGRAPMMVLGEDCFDVTSIDEASVTFGAVGDESAAIPGATSWGDFNRDGYQDAIFQFPKSPLATPCGTTLVHINGTFGAGERKPERARAMAPLPGVTRFHGSDDVKVTGCATRR